MAHLSACVQVRAHQLQDEGYAYHFDTRAPTSKSTRLAPVITVFSAPNYCGVHGNKAAVLNLAWDAPDGHVHKNLLDFFVYEAVPEPQPKSFVDQLYAMARTESDVNLRSNLAAKQSANGKSKYNAKNSKERQLTRAVVRDKTIPKPPQNQGEKGASDPQEMVSSGQR